jgi:hypothetical protein
MIWLKQPASYLYIRAQMDFNRDEGIKHMLLKMDIEGDEWAILKNIEPDLLSRFTQIVVELHNVHEAEIAVLQKLHDNFYLGHVHGNNHSGIREGIPDVIECTFIRKDCTGFEPEDDVSVFPVAGIDFPNKPEDPDYQLCYWFKHA